MASKKWSELSPLMRVVIVKAVALDLGLRSWALADLVKRPTEEIKGSKTVWALALAFVSSAGVLPTVYLTRARKTG